MTPPSILLERSFLVALTDQAHPLAASAAERYTELVGHFREHTVRLRARHDHLATIDTAVRRSLLAPVQPIHVARQFRRQAARLSLPFDADHDLAVTLVVMRRESIERIATFDEVFDRIALRPVP